MTTTVTESHEADPTLDAEPIVDEWDENDSNGVLAGSLALRQGKTRDGETEPRRGGDTERREREEGELEESRGRR
jgi:hypothetical protein